MTTSALVLVAVAASLDNTTNVTVNETESTILKMIVLKFLELAFSPGSTKGGYSIEDTNRLHFHHIRSALYQVQFSVSSCFLDSCIDAKYGSGLAIQIAVGRIEILAIRFVVYRSCRESLDIGIPVTDGNHNAVSIDAIKGVCLLTLS
mgnify:CR=1 FL=1